MCLHLGFNLPKLMSMFRVTKIIKPIQFIAIRSCSYFAVHHKAKKRGLFVLIFGYKLKRKVMEENQMAFPSLCEFETSKGTTTEYHTGLTKREYFAGLAMQGLIQSGSFNLFGEATLISISEKSTKLADELLKQLEQ